MQNTLQKSLAMIVFLAVLMTAGLMYLPWYLLSRSDLGAISTAANDAIFEQATSQVEDIFVESRSSLQIMEFGLKNKVAAKTVVNSELLFILSANEGFAGVGIAYDNGDYIEVRRQKKQGAFIFQNSQWNADKHQALVKTQEIALVDNKLTLGEAKSTTNSYYAPDAVWFEKAKANPGSPIWTDPYIANDGTTRFSTALRFTTADKGAITVLIDIRFAPLAKALSKMTKDIDTGVFLLNRQGHLIAYSSSEESTMFIENNKTPSAKDSSDTTHIAVFNHWVSQNSALLQKLSMTNHLLFHDAATDDGYFVCLGPTSNPNWLIGTVMPEDVLLKEAKRHSAWLGWAFPCVILAAITLTILFARRFLVYPLLLLRARIEELQDLDFVPTPPLQSSIAELQEMDDAVAQVETALQSLKKYMPADLIRQQMRAGQAASLGCKPRQLTVMRTRIPQWKDILVQKEAERFLDQLPAYLEVLTTVIMNHGGTIDKFMDDTVFAFFGAPVDIPQHALQACKAAQEMQRELKKLNAKMIERGNISITTHIAIHTDETLVGNIGTNRRMVYSATGIPVRYVRDLCNRNVDYGAEILITQQTKEAAGDNVQARPIDYLPYPGQDKPIIIYQLFNIGEANELSEEAMDTRSFRMAFRAYWDGEYSESLRHLRELAKKYPEDEAVQLYIKRCLEKEQASSGPNWDALANKKAGPD